jgi:antitoxin PrlF
MKDKIYTISSAKIGNQQGFRLPRAFYQDHPHLSEASGEVEVLNEDILLIRLNAKNNVEEENEGLMMSLFLDFLVKNVLENPEQLIPYTEEMSREIDHLLADVKQSEE